MSVSLKTVVTLSNHSQCSNAVSSLAIFSTNISLFLSVAQSCLGEKTIRSGKSQLRAKRTSSKDSLGSFYRILHFSLLKLAKTNVFLITFPFVYLKFSTTIVCSFAERFLSPCIFTNKFAYQQLCSIETTTLSQLREERIKNNGKGLFINGMTQTMQTIVCSSSRFIYLYPCCHHPETGWN